MQHLFLLQFSCRKQSLLCSPSECSSHHERQTLALHLTSPSHSITVSDYRMHFGNAGLHLLEFTAALNNNNSKTQMAKWLEWWTHDQKVLGSSPSRSGWRIFFSRANFLCGLLLWYLFHPCVTAVACKRSRSFCQNRRWQVTAKHTCILRMWLQIKWHCKLAHGWNSVHRACNYSSFTWHWPLTTKQHCNHFSGCSKHTL